MDSLRWTTEKRKIKDLIPAEYNPRQMTERQAKELRKSLEHCDLAEIPAVNTDNVVLAGHQRLAMLSLMGRGEETIDVRVPNRKLTEREAMKYNVISNKVTGQWDVDKLFAMPRDLLTESGFSNAELDLLLNAKQPTPEDEYDPTEELEKPAKAKFGDLYQLGEHRLLCGDATDTEAYKRLLGGDKAAMMFTDPPYNVDYQGGAGSRRKGIENDKMAKDDFRDFLDRFARAALSNLDGVFYVCMSPKELGTLKSVFEGFGSHWQSTLIWVKDAFTLSGADYQHTYEPILYGWTGKDHVRSNDRTKSDVWEELTGVKVGKDGNFTVIRFQGFEVFVRGEIEYGYVRRRAQKTDVWRYNKPKRSELHPTMKPIELVEEAVKNSSRDSDIVLDPFLGSGSTLVACENLVRRCYGMELDPKYCDVIIDRWEKLTGKKAEKVA